MLSVGGGHHRLRVLIGVVDDREANSTLVEVNGAILHAENLVVSWPEGFFRCLKWLKAQGATELEGHHTRPIGSWAEFITTQIPYKGIPLR